MIGFVMMLLRLQETAPAGDPVVGLTGGSIAFMLTAMIGVTALTVWCFARVLRSGDLEPEGTAHVEPPVGGKSSRDEGR